jgi:hypothetical protein
MKLTLLASKKDTSALLYALAVVRMNQNTEGEPLANKQSVEAYKALKQLLDTLEV